MNHPIILSAVIIPQQPGTIIIFIILAVITGFVIIKLLNRGDKQTGNSLKQIKKQRMQYVKSAKNKKQQQRYSSK